MRIALAATLSTGVAIAVASAAPVPLRPSLDLFPDLLKPAHDAVHSSLGGTDATQKDAVRSATNSLSTAFGSNTNTLYAQLYKPVPKKPRLDLYQSTFDSSLGKLDLDLSLSPPGTHKSAKQVSKKPRLALDQSTFDSSLGKLNLDLSLSPPGTRESTIYQERL